MASDYPTVDQALRAVEIWGGTLDLGGIPRNVNLQLHASPVLVGQVRFVKITNCGGGLSPAHPGPVLSVAPGVDGYFVELDRCLVLGTINFSHLFNSRFTDTWVFCQSTEVAYIAQGPAHYNTWDGGVIGCGVGIQANATNGPSTGPNSNTVRGVRFSGVRYGMILGPFVQDWIIDGDQFETCTSACLELQGTRLVLRSGNRFECAGPTGVRLDTPSDGIIETQYWSSCGRTIDLGTADPKNWVIASQPPQQ